MTRTITSHGFKFNIEGDGFVRAHAEGDFERGADAVEAHLDAMDARTVSAVHFADREWQARDCDGDRPPLIDELERVGMVAATAGWRNPNLVSIMISAAR
jgi:hypothetical protein